MDGLTQLRSMLATGTRSGMLESLELTFVEVEPGRAVFEGTPGDHAYSSLGRIHGGYTATLLDSACGCATHSRLAAGQSYTTLELKVAFHRSLTRETGRVRAEGVVKALSRRIAYAEASLWDPQGRLCASATSTLMIL
jgi:uncharacterized protein (TIGR00369 family)